MNFANEKLRNILGRQFLNVIQENQSESWYWWGISMNKNITWEIIQENPDKPWDWRGISANPNITWQIIQENPDKPWDWSWYGIRANPNITRQIIQENPDKPWDWGLIIIIDKVTTPFNKYWECIQLNAKPWDWTVCGITLHPFISIMMRNKFSFYPNNFEFYKVLYYIYQNSLEKNPNKTLQNIREDLRKSRILLHDENWGGTSFEYWEIDYKFTKAREDFINEVNESCLNKEIMENVWSPKNILRYDGKYFDYLQGDEYFY